MSLQSIEMIPKLFKLEEDYWQWKTRFESYIRLTDMRMWVMITEGYEWPTLKKNGETIRYKYADMSAQAKTEYAIEGKALATIQMALPQDCIHWFQKYTTSKELWDALSKHCEGDDQLLKKTRIKLIKKQYELFNCSKGESLEDLISKFYHLTTELHYLGVTYTQNDLVEKFLDALPNGWQDYVYNLQENSDYEKWSFETVVSKLRNREMKRKARDSRSDFTSNLSPVSSIGGTNAVFSGEPVTPILDSHGIAGYVSYENNSTHEAFINGKIVGI